MTESLRASPFPLRLQKSVKELAKAEATKNRRSLNAEISLLIEEGLALRKAKRCKAA